MTDDASKEVAPYPASKLPTLGPVCPKTALSAAIVRSHTTTQHVAAADGVAATTAMTGLGK